MTNKPILGGTLGQAEFRSEFRPYIFMADDDADAHVKDWRRLEDAKRDNPFYAQRLAMMHQEPAYRMAALTNSQIVAAHGLSRDPLTGLLGFRLW